jgi:hypothetical protein
MFTAGEGSKFPWSILRHRMYVHDLLRFTLASRTDLRVRLLHLGSPHLRPKGYSLCKGPVSILSPFFLVC